MTIRNFLISMGAVCALVLLMPLYAKASYQAPNGETYRYKYSISLGFYGSTTYTADLYVNEKIAGYTGGSVSSDKRFYMLRNGTVSKLNWSSSVPGTYDNVNNSAWDNFYFAGVTPISSAHPEFCLYVTSGASGNTINASLDMTTDLPRYSDWNEMVSYLNTIDVDLENIVYDPFIPTPQFNVTYVENTSNATQFFPLEVELLNNTDEYYVEIQMQNNTPSSLGISQSDIGGNFGNYVLYSLYKFESHAIADKYDFISADTMTSGVLTGLLSSAWRSDISSYSSENVEIIPATGTNSAFVNSVWYTALKDTWLQSFRNIACFYGNGTGISVRYFQIRDGVAYGGKVRIWNNLQKSTFYEDIPDYYIPYTDAQGFERDTTTEIVPVETTNPNAGVPENQYGTKTGTNINISIGSTVPNHPDYPTIATYNLDNMLVSTMNNADDLGKFLTNVSGFFAETLRFVPEPIWQVIALGFALSIVVMFLKIL